MGIVEFFIFTFVVLVLAALCNWAIDTFAPGHPAIANQVIWGVAVVVVLVALSQGIGLLKYDPLIPRIR